MIPEPQRTYVLELIAALGSAANNFILAGAQAMKVQASTQSRRQALGRVYPCFAANGAIDVTLAGNGTTPFPVVAIPANPCALTGSTNAASGAFNDSSTGGGIGANGRVHLGKHLDIGAHFLGGDGIGRYGTSTLSDATVRPNGTLALLRNDQALGTLEFHATPQLDIYAYAGSEYASRWMDGNEGYGSNLRRDDGCAVETAPLAAPAGTINTTAVLGSSGFIPGAGRLRRRHLEPPGRHSRVPVSLLRRTKGPLAIQRSVLLRATQHLVWRERSRRWCWSARVGQHGVYIGPLLPGVEHACRREGRATASLALHSLKAFRRSSPSPLHSP
jgi:hypothetical protein